MKRLLKKMVDQLESQPYGSLLKISGLIFIACVLIGAFLGKQFVNAYGQKVLKSEDTQKREQTKRIENLFEKYPSKLKQ